MEKKILERVIEITEGVTVKKEGNVFKAVGQKGAIEKRLAYPGINMELNGKKIVVSTKKSSKKEKRLIGTFESHIKNIIQGVTSGYTYKLKICSGHFPMKVTIEGKQAIINNFLGEKIPRKANILADTKVQLTGDTITVESSDIEKAGQTAANIERATRITKRDRRVFQDGIYMMR